MCGSVSGGVRGKLKLSGNLSTALCNGVAVCGIAWDSVGQYDSNVRQCKLTMYSNAILCTSKAVCGITEMYVRVWSSVRQYDSSVQQCELQRMRYSVRDIVQLFGNVTVQECIQK